MKRIIISRTDNLGDVVLTLPLAGILKSHFPNAEIYFIGKTYTRPIIEGSKYIDKFIDREEIIKDNTLLTSIGGDCIIHVFPDKEIAKAAKRAGIKIRIGTSHRLYHWLYCNKLVHFSRKKSELHEAQLNAKLLKPLGITGQPQLNEVQSFYGFDKISHLSDTIASEIDQHKFNLIVHPKSKGSAREWPAENYFQLAKKLPRERYKLFVTGTEAEGALLKKEKPELFTLPNVIDFTGKLKLQELISLIASSDGLIACSTGPLHIGAAAGKNVLGIYPPMRPIHPGRWAPLGVKAQYLVLNKDCSDCKVSGNCTCIQSITVEQVLEEINKWKKK